MLVKGNIYLYICLDLTAYTGCSREFTHRVKSVSMSKFSSQEVANLENGGNEVHIIIICILQYYINCLSNSVVMGKTIMSPLSLNAFSTSGTWHSDEFMGGTLLEKLIVP